MKTKNIVLASVLILSGMSVAGPAMADSTSGDGHTPVAFCHEGHIIIPDDNSAPAHLAHGDTQIPWTPDLKAGTPCGNTEPTAPPKTDPIKVIAPSPTVEFNGCGTHGTVIVPTKEGVIYNQLLDSGMNKVTYRATAATGYALIDTNGVTVEKVDFQLNTLADACPTPTEPPAPVPSENPVTPPVVVEPSPAVPVTPVVEAPVAPVVQAPAEVPVAPVVAPVEAPVAVPVAPLASTGGEQVSETKPDQLAYTGGSINWPLTITGLFLLAVGVAAVRLTRKA